MLKTLENNANQWLDKYPALKEAQENNPQHVLHKLRAEMFELEEAMFEDNAENVLDEFTDVMNFVAQLRVSMENKYGITEEAVMDHSRYKYFVRNGTKYPTEGYQEGADAQKQTVADCNLWYFYQVYFDKPEHGAAGEYY